MGGSSMWMWMWMWMWIWIDGWLFCFFMYDSMIYDNGYFVDLDLDLSFIYLIYVSL